MSEEIKVFHPKIDFTFYFATGLLPNLKNTATLLFSQPVAFLPIASPLAFFYQ